MDVPIQTAEIFEILSKGQFISSNSSNRKISDLYKVIDDEQNYENLYDFFIR
ncbi:condensin complex protein MksE [Maribellus luteus]|uniref:condensin complex protein MksE n=1 Tax=Maribellus luteus TaxID=2305463 RepID=UPI0026A0CAA1